MPLRMQLIDENIGEPLGHSITVSWERLHDPKLQVVPEGYHWEVTGDEHTDIHWGTCGYCEIGFAGNDPENLFIDESEKALTYFMEESEREGYPYGTQGCGQYGHGNQMAESFHAWYHDY